MWLGCFFWTSWRDRRGLRSASGRAKGGMGEKKKNLKHHQNLHHSRKTRGPPSTTTTHHLPIMWRGKRKKSPNKHGTRSLRDIFTVQATVVNDYDQKLPARGEVPCVSLPVDKDDDDRKLTARGEVPCVSLPVDEDDDGGPLPLEPATKEEVMDFDDDFSSETEFDEDSSSETEFDEDAVDFDGNDTNVFFIVKPFDDAAKKAE